MSLRQFNPDKDRVVFRERRLFKFVGESEFEQVVSLQEFLLAFQHPKLYFTWDLGGPGSGHYGHKGTKGRRGGSTPGTSAIGAARRSEKIKASGAERTGIYKGKQIPSQLGDQIEKDWKKPPLARYQAAKNALGAINNPDPYVENITGITRAKGTELLGIAAVHDSISGDAIFINYMATKRGGLGIHLMRDIVNYARDKKLGLKWKSENKRADTFFNRIGFSKYAKGEGHYSVPASEVEKWLISQ